MASEEKDFKDNNKSSSGAEGHKNSSTVNIANEDSIKNKINGRKDIDVSSTKVAEKTPSSIQDTGFSDTNECRSITKMASDYKIEDKALGENLLVKGSEIKASDHNPKNGSHAFTEELDDDTTCGIGRFRPQWMQQWATSKVFLLLLSFTSIIQGMFFAYRAGVVTTLEKRYAFDSKISGSIMMVEEITPFLLGAVLGYFGSKTHRPRVIAVGMCCSAFASYIFVLPYFIYGSVTHLSSIKVEAKTEEVICYVDQNKESCTKDGRPPTLSAVLIFMLSSFLQGFGTIAFHAIGVPYLDDITKKKHVPLYLAVTHALRILGPVFGFLFASFSLKFNENPLVDPGIGPDDPRWIGAWWLGFLIQGSMLFIFSIPMIFFPRRIPGRRHLKMIDNSLREESIKSLFLGFFAALKRLGTNVLCISILLYTVLSVYGGIGHFIILPRYMEQQFRITASNANLYSGPPGLLAVIISQFLGGVLIWKFKPKAKTLIIGLISLGFFEALGCLMMMLPRCEKMQMMNFGVDYEGLILEGGCNTNCNCTTKVFTPVCGPDGQTTYFSPCFAGCTESFLDSDHKKVYKNCPCVVDPTGQKRDFVTEGYCFEEKCWSQAIIYITMMPILQVVTNVLKVAFTMMLLRAINPEDKSIALGLFEALLCIFGYVPHPVVFGALVDSACLIWEKSCGGTGNCWFYDVEKFNYVLHGFSGCFQILATFSLFGLYAYRKRLHALYEEDDEEETEEKPKTGKGSKNGGATNASQL